MASYTYSGSVKADAEFDISGVKGKTAVVTGGRHVGTKS
jgi:hypothetical protein